MAREIRQFTAVIPPGTQPAGPVTVPMRFPVRRVDRLEIIVPPGPSGLVGFAIAAGGVPVIPYLSDQWIITADERIVWDMLGYPTTGDWALTGYNTDAIAHTVYVRFLLDVVTDPAAATPATIDADVLNPYSYADDGSLIGGAGGGLS